MPSDRIAAVMVHVSDPEAGLDWYQQALPCAERVQIGDKGFACLLVGHVHIEIVRADEKVGSGPSGTVVYWSVPDLPAALARSEGIGATLYRGAMGIENGQVMCQVQDPWGNCLGLRGPAPP